jgi:hypothetical protein
MKKAGISSDLVNKITENISKDVRSADSAMHSADMFAQTLKANTNLFNEMKSAMGVIASGDDQPVTIGNMTIDNINTVSGMTVFTTQLQLVQNKMEIINNMFNFVKQYEKTLGSLQSQ